MNLLWRRVFCAMVFSACGPSKDAAWTASSELDQAIHEVGTETLVAEVLTYLKPSQYVGSDPLFGSGVAVSGSTIVVGARWEDANGSDAGAACVFVRTAHWSQQARLTAQLSAGGDAFGSSVAVSGDTIVVGAWRRRRGWLRES